MTKHRPSTGPEARPMPMDEDLRALAEITSRDIPSLAQVVAAVRSDGPRRARHPFASPLPFRLLVPGALAAGLLMLLVPISYDRTAGHDVDLVVAAAAGPTRVDLITGPLRTALGASSMAAAPGDSNEIDFHAYVPAETVRDPSARVRALAKALAERGYVVRASVVPRHERISGSVFAYARNQWFRVKSEGKSPSDIEAELRRKLDEAGLSSASVSVSGDEHSRQVLIRPGGNGTPGGSIRVELGSGDDSASGTSITTSRIATRHDGVVLHADVTAQGRKVSVEVPHSESLSDGALAAEVESRLAHAGVHVHVVVKDGSLQVEAR